MLARPNSETTIIPSANSVGFCYKLSNGNESDPLAIDYINSTPTYPMAQNDKEKKKIGKHHRIKLTRHPSS